MDTTTAELNPLSNRLLAGLPRDSFQLLAPHLTISRFALGTVLAETGDEIDQVIFPLSGMISLVAVMKDGRAIETATVGRDGVYGEAVAFGPYRSKVRALVQMEMIGAWLTSQQFRKAAGTNQALQAMCFKHNEALLEQARITAACNALHLVEARFCRWGQHLHRHGTPRRRTPARGGCERRRGTRERPSTLRRGLSADFVE